MTDPRDERLERASAIFAYAAVFAIASTLVELACTIGMRAMEVDGLRVEPNVVRTGALLRLPLSFVIGALLGATSSPTPGSVARFVLPSVFAAPWLLLEALSYRTLGTTGVLPRIALLLSPAELFRGPHVLTAILLTTAATIATVFVPQRLADFFRARFARAGVLVADGVAIAVAALIPLGAMAGGSPSLYLGAIPAPLHFLFGKTPAPVPVEEGDHDHHHHPHDGGAAFPEEPTPEDGIARPPTDVRMLLYALEGVEKPLPIRDTSRPFCREASRPSRAPTPRSTLVVVLHGVGTRELEATFENRRAMPNLARIANEGVSFTRFHAVSDDGAQGLVSLLGGVPLVAPRPYSALNVPPTLPSMPRDLGALGFDSFLVHGGEPDLGGFSTLVRSLGFGHFDTPSRDEWASLSSFGMPDATTLDRLKAAVTAQRRTNAERPYLGVATLFGTADPYALPATAEPLTTGDDPWDRFGNALHATDAALGAFYEWYLAEEAPRGTLLVITSDQASSLRRRDETRPSTEPTNARFEIPLVIAGLPTAARDAARAHVARNGGQGDLAPTLLGLSGLGPFGCYRGRDLLGTREPWPERRVVTTAAGRGQRYLVLFDGQFRWQLDRDTEPLAFGIFDVTHDPDLRRDLASPDDPHAAQMKEYVLSYVTVGSYLDSNDRYVPPTPTSTMAVPEPTDVRTVKALGGADSSVSPADLAAAAAAGFGGVGVRAALGEGDSVVVEGTSTSLDSLLARTPAGLLVVVHLPTLAELPPAARIGRGRALLAALARLPLDRLVLLGPEPGLGSMLASYLDVPFYLEPALLLSRTELVRAALKHGAAGVAIPATTGRVGIDEAHAVGLRVLMDGASTYEALGGRPDLWVLTGARPPAPPP